MIDFSKWENLWNTYRSGGKPVPGSMADICSDAGAAIGVIGCAVLLFSFILYASGSSYERSERIMAIGGVVCVAGFMLWAWSAGMPSHTARPSEPPALDAQIVRTWKLDDLDGCGKTNMNPLERLAGDGALPDKYLRDGDWKCVAYRDGRRFDATVHVKGHKVGLYTPDGRELKPAGKDK